VTEKCIYCGELLRIDSPSVMRKITCWAENNKSGRPAKIASPVDLRQYAHRICFETEKAPQVVTGSLF
jgi:hypothetical protein